jgi:hypothetical protein
MTKSGIAEWILSQVLPPDRAAPTVGDWMEDADKRGNIWFWSSVIRTAVSRVWSDLAESHRLVLGLALRSSAPVLAHCVDATLWSLDKALWSQWTLVSVASLVGIGVVTGRWIALRAQDRKVAVCIAASLIPAILIGLAALALPRFRTGPSMVLQNALFGISLLAGALPPRPRQYHPVGS